MDCFTDRGSCFVADEPENVVAKGCCLALGNAVRLPMLVESGEKYYGGI